MQETQEMWVQPLGQGDSLEEEMAVSKIKSQNNKTRRVSLSFT